MSDAIDAEVVLALATKAAQVFGQEDTTLSIPLSPIVRRRQDLEGMLAADTAEAMRLLAEFSQLVNTIPNGPVWSPVGGTYLWDVYSDVLVERDLASASRTPEEEAEYKKAFDLLHVVAADGTTADSPAVVAYRQCRDAWLVALQEYNNRKGTAETSTDQAVKAAWSADEPLLRAQVEDCERRWAVDGRRAEIEEAQRIERRLIDRSPEATWEGYEKLFDPDTPDLFYGHDPELGAYVPTSLRPSNALGTTWARMTLGRDELTALAAAASPALRAHFPAPQDSAVESLSFEYTSMAVQRSWLSTAVFSSRAWRFSDPSKLLSDGAPEPHGLCPSYVAALVLARSVTVTRKAAAGETPPVRPLDIGFLRLATFATPVAAAAAPAALRAQAVEVRDHRTAAAPVVRDHRTPVVEIEDRPVPRRNVGVRISPQVLARLRNNDFERIVPEEPVVVEQPPAPAANAETTAPDDVYVLGFICKRVPKCPDPDPALTW